jgi:hypothetical protein
MSRVLSAIVILLIVQGLVLGLYFFIEGERAVKVVPFR